MEETGLTDDFVAGAIMNIVKEQIFSENSPTFTNSLRAAWFGTYVDRFNPSEKVFFLRLKKCLEELNYPPSYNLAKKISELYYTEYKVTNFYKYAIKQGKYEEDEILSARSEFYSVHVILDGHRTKNPKGLTVLYNLIQMIRHTFWNMPEDFLDKESLKYLVKMWNSIIYSEKKKNLKDFYGGTQMTMYILDYKNQKVWLVQVGDSPVFVFSGQKIIYDTYSPIHKRKDFDPKYTSSFGDWENIKDPLIALFDAKTHLSVVMVSDGVLDGLRKDEARKEISEAFEEMNPENTLERWSKIIKDDMSLMIIGHK